MVIPSKHNYGMCQMTSCEELLAIYLLVKAKRVWWVPINKLTNTLEENPKAFSKTESLDEINNLHLSEGVEDSIKKDKEE